MTASEQPASRAGPASRSGVPRGQDAAVPPPVFASPGQLPREDPADPSLLAELLPTYAIDVPFWTPGLRHTAAALGWRWLIMGPCLFVLALPAVAMLHMPFVGAALISLWAWQIWVLALGVAISLGAWAYRRAIRGRTGPFCIHCGYDLDGAPREGRCSECGRFFVRGIWEEYRRDPAFFRRRVAALRELPALPALDMRGPQPPPSSSPAQP